MMKFSFFQSVTVSLLVAVLLAHFGPGFGSVVPACEKGHFRPKPTESCTPCTVCNGRTIESETCRRNADTVCVARRTCPSDAFLDRGTGLCQRCTRFCPSPLVKTSPCLEEADAECGQRSSKVHGKSSRRRGSSSRSRRRKQRRGKRQKYRLHAEEAGPLDKPEKVCPDGYFYDLNYRKCVVCSSGACEFTEVAACSKHSDRVCGKERPHSSPTETSTIFDPFDSIRDNKLPDTVKEKQRSRLLSNEYPDSSSKGKRIDSEYQISESLDANYPKNHEVNIKSDSSQMVLSNSPEALD
ncbi:uncharacterized protein LOC117305373 [Asterias rubens]|uniref:uncharacterized protein LOC117305373 n=1 Tax=Asterias rubens TaxID=7604 RepID=UPI001454FB25|nr:uncharacterized protein LOC117305373 [Asterias rubens]